MKHAVIKGVIKSLSLETPLKALKIPPHLQWKTPRETVLY